MVIEISFPRGGRKPLPKFNKSVKVKHDYDLFGRNKKSNKNNLTKKKTITETDEPVVSGNIEAESANLINYRTLQDGMVLLGCIREVHKMTLGINLPGKLSGRVMITQISTPYTQLLHSIVDEKEPEGYKPLRQLFSPGEYVAVKVVNVEGTNDNFHTGLSMMPQDINSQLPHTSVIKGMTLWGAISSCEEHGYVVDLGINSCRAFLQKSNIDEGKEYSIGELLWCAVLKSESSAVATTVSLSTLKKQVNSMKILEDVSIDNLLPGMKVELTISQHLVNGLEGKFLNDYTGYVNSCVLKGHFDQIKSYSVGHVVEARIMYIMPITKLIYLTLRNFETHNRGEIKDGSLLNCKIISKGNRGLYVQLRNNNKGFVSFHRLKNKLSVNTEINDYTMIKNSYPKNSQHKCRVLSYDFFEQIYICSLEKELVRDITFSLHDLKVAQEVSAVITEIQPNGFLVQVDNVTCYIRNNHITDVVLQSATNIKTKFRPGQIVKARVWKLNENNNICQLTMKPSLMNEEYVLSSYEQLAFNKQFMGLVKQISTNGLLIEFFGNVYGWVPKNLMSFEKVARPEAMFQIGQLVKCTVLNFKADKKKLTLSLQPPNDSFTNNMIRIGQHVDVKVKRVTDSGIEVFVEKYGINGVIPLLHITKFPDLAPTIAGMYKEGDEITDVVCIYTANRLPIFSKRDNHINVENVFDYDSLKIKTILPCSIHVLHKNNMYIQAPIQGIKKFGVVPIDEITSNGDVRDIDVKRNQYILAKVTSKLIDKGSFKATTKLEYCWDYNLQGSVDNVFEYLQEVKLINNHFKSLNTPLASLTLGTVVTGIVMEVTDSGSYIIDLKNGARAVVHPDHVKETKTVGSEVKGVVLWLDYVNDIAEISLCAKLMTRINNIQDGNIAFSVGKKNKAHAEVLLVKPDFALAVLRGSANRQMMFLPTKLHPNDFFPDVSQYVIGNVINIEIAKVQDGNIIGLLKQVVKNNCKRLKSSGKRARDLSLNSQTDGPRKKRIKKEETSNDNDQNIKKLSDKKQKKKNDKSAEIKNTCNTEEIAITKDTNKVNKTKKKNNVELEILTNKSDNSNNETKTKKDKKRKTSEEKEPDTENINTENLMNKKEKKRKTDNNITEKSKINIEPEVKNKKNENIDPILPGANNFWNIPEAENVEEASSGDEDKEQELVAKQQKKKKMTPAERAEAARIEEERIRKIETELADTDATPKTADQFDRLVLANPNNSLLWINYMAFHLEGTEIEKARAIARKALSTIEFREEQEKMNVWIAFLNLENRYGTKDSFTSTLEEAVQMNDALSIYLQALNILSESKKTTEFNELLLNVTRKFKPNIKMWTGAADSCYKCDLKEQARNLMQRALKSLDEKQHVNLLVQFAFMESRYNEPERAEALLEKVLASYPRRVDVWTSYVEMLVKGNRIQIARNVLERAVGQKLPSRKMKTIFTKYVQFETKYGNEENVKKVREIAANYVKTALQ